VRTEVSGSLRETTIAGGGREYDVYCVWEKDWPHERIGSAQEEERH
jgi:hypothetical protein